MMDGRRVLIAEDEYLIALDLIRQLQEAGAKVVGPVASYGDAIAIIDETDLDGAIVDVALKGRGGRLSVADVLAARRIPFIFGTGFLRARDVPAHHAAVPRIEKPFAPGAVLRALEDVMSSAT